MLKEFKDELSRIGRSEHTIRAYVERLEDFFNWLADRYGEEDNTAITTLDIREYQSFCLNVKKYAPAGIQQRLSALKAYCGFLEAKGVLSSNPTASVKPIKTVKKQEALEVLSRSELHRFRREVYKSENLRDIAVLEVLLQTGVRVSELVSLELDDIEMSDRQGTLTVRQGKGRKFREVPLSADARRAIANYLTVRPLTFDKRLFQGQRGPLSTDAISKLLKKYAERVGLADKVHPHLFRHQMATQLLRKKKQDITLVAELLGHASLNTTMVYTKPTAKEKAEAVEGLFD